MTWYLPTLMSILLVFYPLLCRNCYSGQPIFHHKVRHKRLDAERIIAIKQDIITKLGFPFEPKISRFNATVSMKREMMKLYEKSIEDSNGKNHKLFSEEEFYAKSFLSFAESKKGHEVVVRDCVRFHLEVNTHHDKDPTKETHVHSADLKLYILKVFVNNLLTKKRWNVEGLSVRLNAYQLLESSLNNTAPFKKLVGSIIVPLDGPGWVTFEVKGCVQSWLDNPEKNFGIEVTCDTQNVNDIITFASYRTIFQEGLLQSITDRDILPSISVLTQERNIIRQKRSSSSENPDCVRGDGQSSCCRYPLTVHFHEIGWDWVVAPDSFKAYYCDGSCPHMHRNAHRFNQVQSLVHMMNPAAAPAPCCSANELTSITLLHYDTHGQLTISEFSDLIVQSCGCS